jgi:hypothetical protein
MRTKIEIEKELNVLCEEFDAMDAINDGRHGLLIQINALRWVLGMKLVDLIMNGFRAK